MRSGKLDAQRIVQTILYLLCLCAASIIVGVYGYFLSYLRLDELDISVWKKVIEGISGATVLYTLINAILTCCLDSRPFLATISFVLDTCFAGGFIAIAVLTRQGTSTCSGYLHTPLGSGFSYDTPPRSHSREGTVPYLWFVCSLEKAVFAVSIIAIVILITTAIMQLLHFRRQNWKQPSGHTARESTGT
jgi:hypothetical protein